MAQATMSVRMDADIKRQFEEFCESVGMNATTAINMFVRVVVRDQALPFRVSARPNRAKPLRETIYDKEIPTIELETDDLESC